MSLLEHLNDARWPRRNNEPGAGCCGKLCKMFTECVTGEAEAIVNGVSRRETALAGGEHRG